MYFCSNLFGWEKSVSLVCTVYPPLLSVRIELSWYVTVHTRCTVFCIVVLLLCVCPGAVVLGYTVYLLPQLDIMQVSSLQHNK